MFPLYFLLCVSLTFNQDSAHNNVQTQYVACVRFLWNISGAGLISNSIHSHLYRPKAVVNIVR